MVINMLDKVIRIATRQSPLALWQARYVQSWLIARYRTLRVELVPMLTRGDLITSALRSKVGGKGLFVKELERALLEDRSDIAVHSMKDVPVKFPIGLGLISICKRDDPRDALVSTRFSSINQLPEGSIIGTSSLRRQCQLRERRPDLVVRELYGNINTRLKKLDNGDYDAIILAAAGLKRLGLEQRIVHLLSVEESLPAVGQGALGIECRLNDVNTRSILAPLNHKATETRIRAERAMNARLGGGCQVPIGSYAELNSNNLWLRALVGCPESNQIVRGEYRGSADKAEQIGVNLAEELLVRGARKILGNFYQRYSLE